MDVTFGSTPAYFLLTAVGGNETFEAANDLAGRISP